MEETSTRWLEKAHAMHDLGCPLCSQTDGIPVDVRYNSGLRRCDGCDLVYALDRAVSPEDYELAYREQGVTLDKSNLAALALGLRWPRESRDVSHSRYFIKDAQRAALSLLPFFAQLGTPVLDIGCGQGWFLDALSAAGYDPYGLDVATEPIELIRSKGISATVGTVDAMPVDWPLPSAVTVFEVIEHLPDPASFVAKLRREFPDSAVLSSVPSAERWTMLFGREDWDYPPNHLTRWSPRSLRKLWAKAGYSDVEVIRIRPSTHEMAQVSLRWMLSRRPGPLNANGRAVPTLQSHMRSLEEEIVARRRKHVVLKPLEWVARAKQRTALSWLVVAQPSCSATASKPSVEYLAQQEASVPEVAE